MIWQENTDAGGTELRIPAGRVTLTGVLHLPEEPAGLVIFAHGSGSGRLSPRNRFVAGELEAGGLGTLLVDLLTPEEEAVDLRTREHRFDIPRLAHRLVGLVEWAGTHEATRQLERGLFGSSTGAAAALVAAAERPGQVKAVVSRGGRPDLAAWHLPRVQAPTLLIVGGRDDAVRELNRRAHQALVCTSKLIVVPGATHLFEEPGALEQVAVLARDWFTTHLGVSRRAN